MTELIHHILQICCIWLSGGVPQTQGQKYLKQKNNSDIYFKVISIIAFLKKNKLLTLWESN